jgi:hypothetical protein
VRRIHDWRINESRPDFSMDPSEKPELDPITRVQRTDIDEAGGEPSKHVADFLANPDNALLLPPKSAKPDLMVLASNCLVLIGCKTSGERVTIDSRNSNKESTKLGNLYGRRYKDRKVSQCAECIKQRSRAWKELVRLIENGRIQGILRIHIHLPEVVRSNERKKCKKSPGAGDPAKELVMDHPALSYVQGKLPRHPRAMRCSHHTRSVSLCPPSERRSIRSIKI